MKSTISDVQKKIKVGTHGEDYGSWMSNPVFYVFGGIALVTLVLTALFLPYSASRFWALCSPQPP